MMFEQLMQQRKQVKYPSLVELLNQESDVAGAALNQVHDSKNGPLNIGKTFRQKKTNSFG